ncbi:unnamed protein product [Symbiodinium natans]|uniref:Uncharacterized protein n=1 Tax=Symbiodinium natans TaxID=878477 RepID=A0A812LLF2_9DINO|nr:unnamed protein product [Symbiodinium natans]
MAHFMNVPWLWKDNMEVVRHWDGRSASRSFSLSVVGVGMLRVSVEAAPPLMRLRAECQSTGACPAPLRVWDAEASLARRAASLQVEALKGPRALLTECGRSRSDGVTAPERAEPDPKRTRIFRLLDARTCEVQRGAAREISSPPAKRRKGDERLPASRKRRACGASTPPQSSSKRVRTASRLRGVLEGLGTEHPAKRRFNARVGEDDQGRYHYDVCELKFDARKRLRLPAERAT